MFLHVFEIEMKIKIKIVMKLGQITQMGYQNEPSSVLIDIVFFLREKNQSQSYNYCERVENLRIIFVFKFEYRRKKNATGRGTNWWTNGDEKRQKVGDKWGPHSHVNRLLVVRFLFILVNLKPKHWRCVPTSTFD